MTTETNSRAAVAAAPSSNAAPDLGWVLYALGKHAACERWHGITEIASGAIFVECAGSMSVADCPELAAHPPIARRCMRCQALRAQRRLIEMGLAEIEEVTR